MSRILVCMSTRGKGGAVARRVPPGTGIYVLIFLPQSHATCSVIIVLNCKNKTHQATISRRDEPLRPDMPISSCAEGNADRAWWELKVQTGGPGGRMNEGGRQPGGPVAGGQQRRQGEAGPVPAELQQGRGPGVAEAAGLGRQAGSSLAGGWPCQTVFPDRGESRRPQGFTTQEMGSARIAGGGSREG